MNVAITGATGLIGTALATALRERGATVRELCRPFFNPNDSTPRPDAFEGTDAVVHLAGETVAGRWTSKKKAAIYDSRVLGTRTVVQSLQALATKPKVL